MSAYTFLRTAISFLIVGSLVLMVARIYLPWVTRSKDTVLLSYVIPFRLRVRLQRANIYSLMGVLVLGSVGHWITPLSLLMALACMAAILAVPARYAITKNGITLGRSTTYHWSEFSAMEQRPGRVHLIGKDDWRPVDIWLPRPPDEVPVLKVIRRYLPVAAPARDKRSSRPSFPRVGIMTRQ
jgi:hypothetical protein